MQLINMKKIILFLLVLFMSTAFAAPIVNLDNISEFINNDYNITFNIQSNNNPIFGILNYDVDQINPHSLIKATTNIASEFNCDNNNFLTTSNCFWTWQTNTLNGTYYVRLSITDSTDTTIDWSNQFIVDNTPPQFNGFDNNVFNPFTTELVANISDNLSDTNVDLITFKINSNILNGPSYLDYNQISDKLNIDLGNISALISGNTYPTTIDINDRAGNNANFTSSVLVDFNKPILIDFNVDSPTNTPTPNLDVNAIDNESDVNQMRFSCDNANWSDWISYNNIYNGFDITNGNGCNNNNNGDKNVFVQVRDLANNESDSIFATTIFDNTIPDINISTLPSGWVNTDQNVTISCSDNLSTTNTINYYLNGILISTTDSNITFTVSSDTNNELVYSCTDTAGNIDGNYTTYIAIDKVPPITTSNLTNTWKNTDINLVLTCDDNSLSGCNKTYFSDGNWADYNSPILFSTDGNHEIQFYSTDNVDNNEPIKTEFVLIDKTPPTSAIIEEIKDSNSINLDLNWIASTDTLSDINTYQIFRTIDINVPAIFVASTTLTSFNDGPLLADQNYEYCYFIRTIDNAGNDSNSNISCAYVDTNKPIITSLTASKSTNNVTINYTADDTYSGINYYLISTDANGPFTQTTNLSKLFSSQSNGDHNYYLIAVDNAGNYSDQNMITVNVNYTPSSGGGGGGSSGGSGGSSSTTTTTDSNTTTPDVLGTPNNDNVNIETTPQNNDNLEILEANNEPEGPTGAFLLDNNNPAASCTVLGLNFGSLIGICWYIWVIIIILIIIAIFIIKKKRDADYNPFQVKK